MTPTQQHIEYLIANPNTASKFDDKYGQGAALEILNKANSKQEEDGLIDNTIQGVVTGVKEGTRETLETLEKAGDWLQQKVPLPGVLLGSDADNGLIQFISSDELAQKEQVGEASPFQNIANLIPESEAPDSVVEGVVSGITQFAVGWVTGGRLFTPAKVTGRGGKIVNNLAKGAVADFQVFDENQARFSDYLIETFPTLEGSYLEYLAADPEDDFIEGKFKNVIEGLGLGVAADLLFKLAKVGKQYVFARKSGDDALAEKIIKENGEDLSNEANNLYERKVELKKINDVNINQNKKITDAELDKVTKFNETDVSTELKGRINLYRKGKIKINEITDVPLNFEKVKIKSKEELLTVYKNAYDNVSNIKNEFDEVRPLNDVWDDVDELLKDPEQVIIETNKVAQITEELDALKVAAKIVDTTIANQIRIESTLLEQGKITLAEYRKTWDTYLVSLSSRKNLDKNIARAQNAGRLTPDVDITKMYDEYAERYAFDPTDDNGLLYLAKKISKLDPDNLHPFRKFVNDYLLLGKFRSLDKINNVWINGLLSNPKTHAINITSNIALAVLRPIEQIAGGLVTFNKDAVIEGAVTAAGLLKYFSDSLRAASIAWKNGDAVLDTISKSKNEINIEAPKSFIGKIVQSPTKLLTAEDEFFKHINYSSKVYAKAFGEALKKNLSKVKNIDIGKGRKASEFDLYVEKKFDAAFGKDGEALYKDALEYAQENTFTKQLKQGSIGAGVQSLVNNSPLLRQIMPFVRTPVNIALAFRDRTPGIALLSKTFRKEFFNPDPKIRAAAYGKQMLGASLFGTAWALYEAGAITGGVDNNRVKNRQKFDTGWRPYSFKFGDTYYSYERLDPLGMFFGLFADMADVWDKVTEDERAVLAEANKMALIKQMDLADYGELAMNGVFVVAKNLVSKTYVKSLADTLELLNAGNPDRGAAFIRNKIGSFVPAIVPAIINDPYYREAREYTDTLKNRLGFEGDLSYNAMGEPRTKGLSDFDALLNPVTTTKDTKDIVSTEFVRLNQAFGNIGSDIGLGLNIDLTKFKSKDGKNAFTAYNEILSSLGVRQALEELITSDKYKKATDNYVGDELTYKGSKVAYIQNILTVYKKRALNKLLKDKSFVSETGLTFKESYINNKKNNIRQKRSKELLPLY